MPLRKKGDWELNHSEMESQLEWNKVSRSIEDDLF